jgi:hypothetical protein
MLCSSNSTTNLIRTVTLHLPLPLVLIFLLVVISQVNLPYEYIKEVRHVDVVVHNLVFLCKAS